MTNITLHDYLQQIEEFINDHRFDEAVNHCRHILQQYPRHVETYRTLATALLEQDQYQDAADLLHRALSADPSDFIAHVGLSMAYKEEKDLPQSIWHLERALEIKPYNAALQEEVRDLYSQNGMTYPDRIPLSRGALARLYLQGEMYQAAAQELREALNQDEDRIDLKVLLAETLWRDNQRVESVSLCLKILDELPNCIQANAILGEIWLQTGRIEEAQTYLNRLQALTQMDKTNCDLETAVCSAFSTKGSPPIPEVTMVGYQEELAPPIDEEVPDVEWADEFSLGEGVELAETGDDAGEFGWLSGVPNTEDEETAVDIFDSDVSIEATSIPAETNWFVDDADEDDNLTDLLEGLGDVDTGGLADWLHDDTEAEEPVVTADEFDELEIVEKAEAVEEPGLTDLFARLDDLDTGDAEQVADETFDEGLTDLFSHMIDDSDEQEVGAAETEDADLEDFFAELSEDESDTAVEQDISQLAEAVETDEADYHTGYTQLFDELSVDAFPEKEGSDWLQADTTESETAREEMAVDEPVSDWLSEAVEEEFEPVQIDNRLTTNWLNDSVDEAEEESPDVDEEPISIESESPLDAESVEDDTIPTWMLGGEQTIQEFETPSPLDSVDGLSFDTDGLDQLDEMGDDAEVPTWLLGGDQVIEDTGELDSLSQPIEPEPQVSEPSEADDLSILAGEQLPQWLLDDEVEESKEVEDVESLAEPELELGGEPDLFASEGELPDWLASVDSPVDQDHLEVALMGDNDKKEISSQQEPDDGSLVELEEQKGLLAQLEDLEKAADELPMPDEEDDSASLASRIAAGEGAAVDELPTQVELPDEKPDTGQLEPSQEAGDLGWLDELEETPIEPVDEQITLDWSQEDEDIEDMLAGVTGELKADLDWLDTLAEESDAEIESTSQPIESLEIDTGSLEWLDQLTASEDTGPLEELGSKPVLPEFEDSLAELPEESEDGPEWLSTLEVEGEPAVELPDEAAPELLSEDQEDDADKLIELFSELEQEEVDVGEVAEPLDETSATEIEGPADVDDAMVSLEELGAKEDEPLEELSIALELDEDEPEVEADESLPDLYLEAEVDLEPELETEAETIVAELETEPDPLADLEMEAVEAEADAPDDLDDAMAWLEGLAAKQGAPLEELPTVLEFEQDEPEAEVDELLPDFELEAEVDLEPDLDTVQAGLDAPIAITPDDLETDDDFPEDFDDAMGWLEELAAKQGAPLEELPSIAEVVDEPLESADELVVKPEPEMTSPTGESVLEPEQEIETPTDELSEALDWLEEVAREEGADLGEVAVPETAVTSSENELEEALSWLEQLAQEDTPADEPVEEIVAAVEKDDFLDLTDEMPDDPDEALAWLQKWATDEEMGDVVAVEPPAGQPEIEPEKKLDDEPISELRESDIEDEILAEIPDDPDDAMAWLEQLAAQQGAPLEELPSISDDQEVTTIIEPVAALDEDIAEQIGQEEMALSEVDTASWLDEMAEEVTSDDMPDLTEILDLEPEVEEAEVVDEPEVPEDMDDAMAWLEELAAQQGASLEELPSLSGRDEEILAEVDDETAVEPEFDEELITETDVDVTAIEESEPPTVDSKLVDDESDETEIDLDEDDVITDWLDLEPEKQQPGQTEWLRSLDEPDISGWLEEEDATLSSRYDRSVPSRFDPQPELVLDTGPLSLDSSLGIDTGPLSLPEEESVTSVFDLDDSQLTKARGAVNDGQFDEALQMYQGLVDAGGGMMTLIADLETAADENKAQPLFRHLLGDAYMRNGQLQKALDTYRLALDQI